MNATLCAIRRTTIVQVTRPPLSLWRFHWHELFPVARADQGNGNGNGNGGGNGNGRAAIYLQEVEPGDGRWAVCSRLREALAELPPETGAPVVVEGYMVEILENRAGLLPDFLETNLEALIARYTANGNSANGNSANGGSPNGGPPKGASESEGQRI